MESAVREGLKKNINIFIHPNSVENYEFFSIIISNEVRVIRDILNINKIEHVSRHFEGKSRFGMSGGRGCV